jgi:hypothetical protein
MLILNKKSLFKIFKPGISRFFWYMDKFNSNLTIK